MHQDLSVCIYVCMYECMSVYIHCMLYILNHMCYIYFFGKAGKDSTRGCSRLFRDVNVLFYGQFPTPGPPRSDLEDLVVRGGAVNHRDLKSRMAEDIQRGEANSNLAMVCVYVWCFFVGAFMFLWNLLLSYY